uniref:DNA polymerase subunit gamma-2, mitochondrial n=1 Tax=Lygus hesperus TaxID=30085 RepID=A0A0A9Y702_LYGHE
MQALRSRSQDLVKFLNHLESFGFIRVIGSEKAETLRFGPAGELVLHNLRNEWLHSTTTYREMNVFPYHTDSESCTNSEHNYQDLKSAFSVAKFLSGDSPPFGIAYSRTTKERDNHDPLYPQRHVELKQIIFEKPQVSKQYFYRHLQQRKRWWRKFAADPGRFSFGDVIRISESSIAEEAQILVTFPWGVHEVEKVRYRGCEDLDNLPIEEQNDFTVLYDRKRSLPHVIESYFSLDYGVLTYMFDAYYERKSGRPVLKFHRKLSPYKYGFAAGSVSSAVAQELYDMSRMICLDLKKEGLGCLFPSPQEFGKKGLETQLAKHDALGICYTVVLNEGSLKSGLCGLYNRETTLQEQTHISKLPEYCSLIMKNY